MNERGGSSWRAGAAAPVAAAGGVELLLRAEALDKSFFDAGREVRVLRGLELEVKASEEIAIVGQSGTGKSTLLHVLGSLETPTTGKVYFEGQDLFALSERALAEFRNLKLGFVFQFHYLLADFSALENVMMRGAGAGGSRRQASSAASRAFRRRAAARRGGARRGVASAPGAG
jgi:lipoprotein-releasing system ATP-binding protein